MGHDLKNMTGKQALILAKAMSGLTNDEISERSGISPAEISRYFGEHQNYYPGFYRVPSLCRALGNTILIEWQGTQVEEFDITKGLSAKKLLKGIAQLGSETGHVFAEAAQAMGDGKVDSEEAKRLNGELADVEKAAHTLRERLQPLAAQIHEGGKLRTVLIVSEDGQ